MKFMTTIYKKHGRRYVEIGICDIEAYYYPHGAHLVWSRPGSRLTKYSIDPTDAALLAAAERARDAMAEAMAKINTMRPATTANRRPLTAKERKGWEAYKAIAGEPQGLYLEGVSLHDIVQAGINALIAAAKGET